MLEKYSENCGSQRRDWATAWKQYYHPVKISERFTIVPSWEQYTPMSPDELIELDPGMAFGTARINNCYVFTSVRKIRET